MHPIPEADVLMQADVQPEVLARNRDESGSEATAPNPPPIAETSGPDETTVLQHEAAPNPPPSAESVNGEASPSTKVDVGDYVVVNLGSAGKHYIGQIKEFADDLSNEISISFMTTQGSATYYCWPNIEDLSWEQQSSICYVLGAPICVTMPRNKRRKCYQFQGGI
ncbi:uncharacterized protein LOC121372579 [Gigantopelta aegis]|uniref:uncharacterized protein LOC121372579 n=1 Tax=Gigantopelta aegis TaxID=1735272 RepID=UPI001B88A68A|nr:uncharacterized protein LOC121372579 [Gigantopelta aegis]XP_041354912.1 uncharacterized protein LOC121372579 [Gigantopelta aegis]